MRSFGPSPTGRSSQRRGGSSMRVDGLAEVLDGRTSYTPEGNERLWLATPPGLRQSEFMASTVPTEYRDAFSWPLARHSSIELDRLPQEMQREMAWFIFRTIELGGKIPVAAMQALIRRLAEATDRRRLTAAGAPCSVMELPLKSWEREIATAVTRRTGKLPTPTSMGVVVGLLSRCYHLLCIAYDPGPWWQRGVWDLMLDERIPHRPHEPCGRDRLHFHRIRTDWLRLGMQWHAKVSLETGALTWSSLRCRVGAIVAFDRFLAEREVSSPWLRDDPGDVRVLMLDFLSYLRQLKAQTGAQPGQP